MIRRVGGLVSAVVMAGAIGLAASPVHAQGAEDAAQRLTRPARPTSPGFGVRIFVAVDANALAASQTFDAVLGTSTLTGVGGGADVIGLWRGVFVRVGASSMKKTGSRVLVDGTEVSSLGIPVTIEMRPVEFGAGWRTAVGRRRRVSVYAGAGLLHMVYRESSQFAGVGDNTDTTFNGAVVFGGADVRAWRWVVAGVEAQVRSLPNAIGRAGASQAFKETDLGGGTVRALVGVRF